MSKHFLQEKKQHQSTWVCFKWTASI